MEENLIFSSIYEPKLFSDLESNLSTNLIQDLIDTNNINILLNGPSMSGKTILLKCIINEYFKNIPISELKDQILYINSIKEQGINFYRNEVKTFCQTCSRVAKKKKIIVLDDIDLLSESSQQVFRTCIDKYNNNIFIISSCKNLHKVIENFQSRVFIIKTISLTENDCLKILKTIAKQEQIKLSKEIQNFLIKSSNGNIKYIINNLEKLKLYNNSFDLIDVKNLSFNININYLESYIENIFNKNLKKSIEIIFEIYDRGYSVIDILDVLYNFIKTSDSISEKLKYDYIPVICKYIVLFYNIHENPIELALFTQQLIKLT